MVVHRGRIDLLEAHLDRHPSLLEQRFEEGEIFPLELGSNRVRGYTERRSLAARG